MRNPLTFINGLRVQVIKWDFPVVVWVVLIPGCSYASFSTSLSVKNRILVTADSAIALLIKA